ncbi:Lrp/AsnC family transcriptional regulator [Arthrobacter castelli]|uniref:Lrp/AsnC family transcriptional regulator n=1 Tax=Arthrobacter castelli TaxID=271431 RepID=UPI0004286DAA|nr:Lrp/AsnC family transcriptional regulator [Arthrobacter castelli]
MSDDLDDIDWDLLRELQTDGRASIAQLARLVRLSPTATADRIRRLESKGVITGYTARVDLKKVGVAVMAVVRLKYPGRAREPLGVVFDKRPEILECQRVTGEDCYILKLAAASMDHLAAVVDDLGDIGGVTTNIVYNEPMPYRGLEAPLSG